MFQEVDSVLRTHQPTVKVRHYAFLDFARMGYKWNPDWFSLVRNPIEKVRNICSFFKNSIWNSRYNDCDIGFFNCYFRLFPTFIIGEHHGMLWAELSHFQMSLCQM